MPRSLIDESSVFTVTWAKHWREENRGLIPFIRLPP